MSKALKNIRYSFGAKTDPGDLRRSTILDQLRSCAILLVITFHVVQMSPTPLSDLAGITQYGAYGVDLFFILSGWLIGGIYWREMKAFGQVDTRRFWLRRWMRTLPSYFVALVLSWLAVYWMRSERFDWHYIVFMQNYYERIPFFLVSWSLCIEEHFYLAAPLVAAILIISTPKHILWLPWVVFIFLSLGFRYFEWKGLAPSDFGYSMTATHLRLDGLVLGFGLSYLPVFAPGAFKAAAKSSIYVVPLAVIALIALEHAGDPWRAILWPTTVAIFFAALVVVGVSREGVRGGTFGRPQYFPWTAIAAASYSAYLIHPLAIHVSRKAITSTAPYEGYFYWPVVIFTILIFTYLFYHLFERSSLLLRDAWVPSRASALPAQVCSRYPADVPVLR
jgi:peptidoglycan/LPS O-acetylase OafA/YrhL